MTVSLFVTEFEDQNDKKKQFQVNKLHEPQDQVEAIPKMQYQKI